MIGCDRVIFSAYSISGVEGVYIAPFEIIQEDTELRLTFKGQVTEAIKLLWMCCSTNKNVVQETPFQKNLRP